MRNEQIDVEVNRLDQLWVGDITYLKVGGIYRYLAVVMDKYSRRILGWAYGKREDVAQTLTALNRAVRYRQPSRGLIFTGGRFRAPLIVNVLDRCEARQHSAEDHVRGQCLS